MSRAMVLLLLGAALPAGAQSPAERAEQALPGMPDLGGMQGAEGTVVIPFAGTEMPERNFNPNTFEDNIQTIRQTPGTQNRVLEGTEDSYLTRPGFTVTPEDLANPDAVVRDAPNIAGSYFTEETGSCENPDLPPSQPIDRFCTSREVLETRSCDQIRNIWIDRTDWYRCDVREEVFVRFCERDVTYSCVIETDTNACIRNNVTFDGGTVSWSGNEATVHFPEAPRTDTDAAIYDHMFTIRLSDRFHADAVSVRRIRAKAVVQLALGDEIVGTWAENINPDFGQYVSPFDSPFAEPGEPLCADSPTTVPVGAYVMPTSATTMREFASFYNTGVFYWFFYTLYGSCFFADLSENRDVDANALHFFDLPEVPPADPEGPRQWVETAGHLRMVYEGDRDGMGSGSLTIAFEGSCCDSFVASGGEECEE
jgi:hypothetical protein